LNIDTIISEIKFKAVRSSGSGGQHVNKVATKVELSFDVEGSNAFSDEEKSMILKALEKKLTKNNVLIVQCDESRSQHKNKELATKRLIGIIEDGLKVRKKRIPTKTPKKVVKKRLEDKRLRSIKKSTRKKPDID
jgi:ribosome-associated protein